MPRRSLVCIGPVTGACSVEAMTKRSYQWSELPHLARRTLWSLRKPTPDPAGDEWLRSLLSPQETLLYRSMTAVDRAHAISCAQCVDDLDQQVVVASALHDVGKTDAGLGTPGRVVATFCGLLIAERARTWHDKSGLRRQVAVYLDHTERGAAALIAAGSSDVVIAWAREHHLDAGSWTIPPAIAARLKAADDAEG